MGYHRDRSTRAPGAIAAWDRSAGAPARLRRQRRVDAARATRRRDQVMSAIAGGALGRVNLEIDTPVRKAGGSGLRPVATAKIITPPMKPPVPVPTPMPVKVVTLIDPAPMYTGIAKPPVTIESPPIIATSPPILAADIPLPTRLPPVPMSSGSGSVAVTGGIRPTTPIDPSAVDPLPDIDDASASGGHAWMWWGGAALAVYLMTRGRT